MTKQKTRTQKTSPNTAGEQRRISQESAAKDNRRLVSAHQLTPWQIACNKRKQSRIKAGKPEQFAKKQAYNQKKLAAVK